MQKKRAYLAASLLVTLAGCAGTPPAAVKPTDATVAAHVAEATRLAQRDRFAMQS